MVVSIRIESGWIGLAALGPEIWIVSVQEACVLGFQLDFGEDSRSDDTA